MFPKKLLKARMLGLIQHRSGRPRLHHTTALEENHPVGDVPGKCQFVSDQQQGHALGRQGL